MFNKHALYSDESPQYQIPFEPNPGDTVKIRFRTLKNNVDAVYFISGSTRAQMQVGLVRNGFDYYEIEIPVGNEPIRYFFEIQAGRVVCYYNKLGVTRELQEMYSFGIIPGFHTPDWAKGAVMYQIFVDRFCNGDPSNDVLTGEYSYIGEQVNKWMTGTASRSRWMSAISTAAICRASLTRWIICRISVCRSFI